MEVKYGELSSSAASKSLIAVVSTSMEAKYGDLLHLYLLHLLQRLQQRYEIDC